MIFFIFLVCFHFLHFCMAKGRNWSISHIRLMISALCLIDIGSRRLKYCLYASLYLLYRNIVITNYASQYTIHTGFIHLHPLPIDFDRRM